MSELGNVDERKVARAVAIWLPIGTICAAASVGTILGPAIAILVLGAGALLGVVAILWASIRVLTGDAALPPEIEALDQRQEGVDLLASKKKMMILALKDLENEHAIGKLDDEDFDHISQTYRTNLKTVLKEIEAELEPFRAKAEAAASKHLAETGLNTGYRGALPADESEKNIDAVESAEVLEKERLSCAKCNESNEPDAKFCKGCGGPLGLAGVTNEA